MRTWRGRFATGGLPALADRKRSGRPASFTALQVAEVKALARQLPAKTSTRCRAGPARNWSGGGRADHRRVELPFQHAAPAQVGRAQVLAVPVLDPRTRPRLPAQSRACWTLVHPHVRRHCAERGRVRDPGGREDFRPGARPRRTRLGGHDLGDKVSRCAIDPVDA
nr:helix-turn-helix domain-containing protein [Streptomyces mirabilis]